MRVLDLFSGIGGFSLGLERAGMETVAFCEYDEKCRQVLNKHWPDVPIYDDVRTLTGEQLEKDGIRDIGLICGGYPCQPFSNAGKRKGQDDDRHLWPEYFRLIKEIRPTWAIAENVAGHISMGLDSVLSDLESEDYTVQTFVIPACAVGAHHRRDRVWIVAHARHAESQGWEKSEEGQQRSGRRETRSEPSSRSSNVADTQKLQRDGGREHSQQSKRQIPESGISGGSINVADTTGKRGRSGNAQRQDASNAGESSRDTGNDRSGMGAWLPEPPVGRVANGVPGRVDRLKQLGNAVVPQIPEVIGRAIMEAEHGA